MSVKTNYPVKNLKSMENRKMIKKQKRFRTARLAVSAAIEESLAMIKILKKLSEMFENHHKKFLETHQNRTVIDNDVVTQLSTYEFGKINGALRDYITLRIANIADPHPASVSLKDFNNINLEKIRKIPQIKKILNARDNWIGHINKRFIGPVDKEILFSKKIDNLLEEILFLICTENIKEKEK